MAWVSLSRCSSDVRSSAGDTGTFCRPVAALAGSRLPVAGSDPAALGGELAADGLALAGRGWVAAVVPTVAFGWAAAALEGASLSGVDATGPVPGAGAGGGTLVAGCEAGGPTGGGCAAGAACTGAGGETC